MIAEAGRVFTARSLGRIAFLPSDLRISPMSRKSSVQGKSGERSATFSRTLLEPIMHLSPMRSSPPLAASAPIVKLTLTDDLPAMMIARLSATPGKHEGKPTPILSWSGNSRSIYSFNARATASVEFGGIPRQPMNGGVCQIVVEFGAFRKFVEITVEYF